MPGILCRVCFSRIYNYRRDELCPAPKTATRWNTPESNAETTNYNGRPAHLNVSDGLMIARYLHRTLLREKSKTVSLTHNAPRYPNWRLLALFEIFPKQRMHLFKYIYHYECINTDSIASYSFTIWAFHASAVAVLMRVTPCDLAR